MDYVSKNKEKNKKRIKDTKEERYKRETCRQRRKNKQKVKKN